MPPELLKNLVELGSFGVLVYVLIHLLTDTRNAVEKAQAKSSTPAAELPKKDGMGVGSAEMSRWADTLFWGMAPAISRRRELAKATFC